MTSALNSTTGTAILSAALLDTKIGAVLEADNFFYDSWTSLDGATETLTYSFESQLTAETRFTDISGARTYTTAQKDAVRAAFDLFEEVANVTFVEVASASADIQLYRADDIYTNSTSSGFGGGKALWSYMGRDWKAATVFQTAADIESANEFWLILHELGHVMGLKHTGDVDSGGNLPPGPFLGPDEDNTKYSVMSYNQNPDTNQHPSHLMLYDIAALQAWWGKNDSHAVGNTTYVAPRNGGIETIWDAGGIDTLSYNGSSNAIIDLRQGAFSSLGQTDNLAIAYGVDIENASGGSGDDIIAGNTLANTIRGNSGKDRIKAHEGNDKVYDGSGADEVSLDAGNDYVLAGGGQDDYDGGSGKDYLSYYNATGGITVNLGANSITGSWANNDTINSFESFSGSNTGGDTITGTAGSNTIRGNGGADKVYALTGNDYISLGAGNDYVLVGGGVEQFFGGSGSDYISYYNSSGGISIHLGRNTVSGSWASNDTISSFESASGSATGADTMIGSSAANTLRGYGGDDVFYGGSGSDKIYGGNGEDWIDGGGGSGTDQIWGGSGADTFHFDKGDGTDIIRDFENNVDRIELDNFGLTNSAAFGFADQIGNDVVFDFGADGNLTIQNTTLGQLQNDLFMV